MDFEWLAGVSPRWGAWLHALAWVAIALWVWTRPLDRVLEGAPDRARWRDLRLWVLPLAAIQVALYFLL